MAQMSEETVVAAGGTRLAARFFLPEDEKAEVKGSVLLVAAMGVSQGYYEPFAGWLADQGYCVATFDYRGVGRSRTGSLRGYRADLFDWAADCGALVEALTNRAPGLPFYWIGHSLGGQILPFVANRDRIAKVVTIASGSGYWLENSPPTLRRAWWLWFFVVPLALPLFGYFPGRKLRKVGDLPKGVMAQWRRWCLNREYAVGVEGEGARQAFAEVRTPIVALSFADDEMMSLRNTESLHGFYRNAPKTMKRLAPQDIDEPRIGHFGFFRTRFRESLWRRVLLPELG